MVSKAQQRLMYAASAKPGGVAGVSQKVAKEFVAAGKAEKNLPEHVTQPDHKRKQRIKKLYGNNGNAG